MIIASILLLLSISANGSIFGKRSHKPLECGDNSLVSYEKNGLPKRFPWSVFLRVDSEGGDRYCEGIIISPDRIFLNRCTRFYRHRPVSIFFKRRKVVEKLLFTLEEFPSLTIKKPNWTRLSGSFYYLTLDKPLKSSSKHAPICISNYIPKEMITDPVYFNWDEKLIRHNNDTFWGIIYHTKISKIPLRPAAISYLKDGKWYLAGINRYHSKRRKTYYHFNGSIPLDCENNKDEICEG